ncbi:helix-turn-helix transcriptional regulator [Brevundimonas sp.]|uniref:helix-turn-helix transcriptional regulator n=1 Tax=Brevundimonas sp. TaxID=1871086 RepID=UPI003D09AC02
MLTHRLRWGLSQEELARLIGRRSHSTISRYEQRGKTPPLSILLAYEIIFGVGLKEMLPDLYGEIEDQVIARGNILWGELDGRSDHSAGRKRELLLAMISRARPETDDA